MIEGIIKDLLRFIVLGVIVPVFSFLLVNHLFVGKESDENGITALEEMPQEIDTANVSSVLDWDTFIDALIQIESGGNDSAINITTNAVGCLQLTPVAVAECNRIAGKDTYRLDDRFDRTKSIEMFNALQNYYNPGRDPHWALKIWNPRSSMQYHIDVFRKYEEMKLSQSVQI